MAVTDQQKLDFLLKKIGYTKTKTGSVVGTGAISGTPKQPFAEAIPSPLIIANSALWNEADSIPATAPGSDTTQVKVYLAATSGLRMTADATSSGQRAYIAYSTYGNTSSTRLTNWIDTQFGASYLIKVYKGDPNSGGVALSAAGSGANDGWFFDYSAGVLNFNDTSVPSGVTDTNIYIVGYRYVGQTGAPTSGISTFSYLDLTVERNLDIGSQGGISTFRNNIDANGIIEGIAGENKIPFLYSNLAALPNAGTYHGMFAHVHSEGRGYFAHAGNWLELVNKDTSGNVGLSGDLDVDGHTNLDNVSIAGVTTFNNADVVFQGAAGAQNITFDASENDLEFTDDARLKFGNSDDLEIWHSGNSHIKNSTNDLKIRSDSLILKRADDSEPYLKATVNSDVKIYHNGNEKFATTQGGVNIIGHVETDTLQVSGLSTFTGNIDANGDLDVDGHTNLDNVSIAGVTTTTGHIYIDADNKRLFVGADNDISIYNDGANSRIENASGQIIIKSPTLAIQDGNGSNQLISRDNGEVELFYNGIMKLETASSGISVVGTTTSTQLAITGVSTFTGNIVANGSIDLAGDIDVDGHTNLDNVSIAGVTTFSDNDIFFKNSGITSCKFDSNIGQFYFNGQGGLAWYKNGNLSNSSGAVIYYSEGAVPYGYGGLVIQAPWQGQTNAKNIKVMGSSNGYFSIQSNINANENFRATFEGGVNLGYYQSGTKLQTTTTGVTLNQDLTVNRNALITGISTFTGAIDANGDLDVDGHTNLDNVSVAGVSTFAGDATFNGNVSIGGTLTYEDVKNVDSVGLMTARAGINVTGGVITALAGENKIPSLYSAMSNLPNAGTYHGMFAHVHATGRGYFAHAGNWMELVNKGYNGVVGTGTETYNIGNLVSTSSTATSLNVSGVTTTVTLDVNGDIDVDGHTNLDNVSISGVTTAAGNIVANGSIDLAGDIDVDGHTNLDNVSISGVTTAAGAIDLNADLDVDGHTNLDNVSIAGVTTTAGNIVANGSIDLAGDIDVDGHTNLDNVSIAGFTTITQDLDVDGHTNLDNVSISGITTFGNDVTFQTDNANNLFLDNSDNSLKFGDNVKANFGDSQDLSIFHNGSHSIIQESGTGQLKIQTNTLSLENAAGNANMISALEGNAIVLHFNGAQKLLTTNTGINVIGNVVSTGADINGDLDVDGHTNLDNVSVAGVSTFSDNVRLIDGKKLQIGNSQDLQLHHTGGHSYIANSTGEISILNTNGTVHIRGVGNEAGIEVTNNETVKLYGASNTVRLVTSNTGVTVTGTVVADGADINGDLDVDGHTNLDNVSVAGVTTFSDNIHVQSSDDTLALFESTDSLAQIQFKDNSSNANLPTIGIEANSFYFNNMGSTSLRIAPGKVGVNEVAPLADFHVNQNEAHSSTYYLDSDAGVLIENINAAASRKSVLKLIGDSAIVYGGSGNGTLIFAQRQKETASFDANGNFSVNYDLDVDGHTNLDNVSIAGVTTFTGVVTLNDDVTFTGANYNALWDKSDNALEFNDNTKATFGTDVDLSIYHDGSNSYINEGGTGSLYIKGSGIEIQTVGGQKYFTGINNIAKLYYANNEKLATTSTGINITGLTDTDTLTTGNATFTGTITAGGSSGSNGQYLKSTGTGVAWENYPTARTTQSFTASSGQTTFSFSYNVGYLDVFVNGVKLSSSEFTATNGTSVVLSVGSFVGDIVELFSYNTIVSGGGGSGISNVVEDTTPQLGGNLDIFNKSITGTGNINITGIITATSFSGPVASSSAPASATSTGTAGTIAYDSNYVYICIATNTWRRVAVSSW